MRWTPDDGHNVMDICAWTHVCRTYSPALPEQHLPNASIAAGGLDVVAAEPPAAHGVGLGVRPQRQVHRPLRVVLRVRSSRNHNFNTHWQPHNVNTECQPQNVNTECQHTKSTHNGQQGASSRTRNVNTRWPTRSGQRATGDSAAVRLSAFHVVALNVGQNKH